MIAMSTLSWEEIQEQVNTFSLIYSFISFCYEMHKQEKSSFYS